MGKQPSFQFYPGDWLKDAALCGVSHAARGVWIDVICIMFECEERGVLSSNGLVWSLDKTAQALRGDTAGALQALSELTEAGVLRRRTADEAYYSARVLRDEQIRKARAKAGKAGGIASCGGRDGSIIITSKTQAKRKQTGKQKDPPSSSSSSSEKKETASAVSRKPVGLQAGKTRARCPVWDAVEAVWYPSGVPTGRRTHVGRIVRDFKQINATAETIRQRTEVYRQLWPDMACTAEAVLKHWDQLDGTNRSSRAIRKGKEPSRVRNGNAAKYDKGIRRANDSEGTTA